MNRTDAKITTLLSESVAVHVYDHGPITLTSLAGAHIALDDEAADRLLSTLLARKAQRDRAGK